MQIPICEEPTRDDSHSHKYQYKNEAKIYVKFRFRDQIA